MKDSNDLDFVARLKMKSSQNRVDLSNRARESIRNRDFDRAEYLKLVNLPRIQIEEV